MAATSDDELAWRTTSWCDGGSCVEVGRLRDLVIIRNSAEPLATLSVGGKQWYEFVAKIRDGVFDHA